MLEKRAGHDDRDDEDGNADYCSYSGKGGELIVCDGCVAAFREQLLEKWQRTKALTMDDDGYIETLCQNPRHLSPTRPHPRKPSNTKISTSSNSMHRVEDIFQPG